MASKMTETPVMFPPGRARLAAKPLATGSPNAAATIGTVAVALRAAATAEVEFVTISSAPALTSSSVSAVSRSYFPSAWRHSMARFRPSVQPSAASPALSAS
jgi:hypothetical protein